jgi:hypothetical protein
MATILFYSSFLAGSIISLLIPVGLLVAIAVWHGRAFMRIPHDPGRTVPHAAGGAEREGRPAGERERRGPAGQDDAGGARV